ncbi:MAG TPA: hypothetical protein VNW15_15970 [Rhizomicrobium sp.]|jgi:hypothetical protein|nr:hypothetical protein [Rhizomicrobium sp.]
MEGPGWYAQWRHQAIHALFEKNEKLEAEFKIGTWPRWDYDLDRACLVFSRDGKPGVFAEVQAVGSVATDKSWLWAWANDSLPETIIANAQATRRFGQEHGIVELTTACLEDEALESLGWELSAITARITSGMGVYRAPGAGGPLFLVFRNVALVT